MYELIYGRPPFMSNDPYEIFQKALNEKIKFPRSFDSDAKSLVKKLTQQDLAKRYGNLRGGAQDVKDHRFFKDYDWEGLAGQRLQAAVIPQKEQTGKPPESKLDNKRMPEFNDNQKFPPIK